MKTQWYTGTITRTAKTGLISARVQIWPGGRQYVDDAATQLLCITTVCTYQLMSDDLQYVHKQQTSRTPRIKTPANSICVLAV